MLTGVDGATPGLRGGWGLLCPDENASVDVAGLPRLPYDGVGFLDTVS